MKARHLQRCCEARSRPSNHANMYMLSLQLTAHGIMLFLFAIAVQVHAFDGIRTHVLETGEQEDGPTVELGIRVNYYDACYSGTHAHSRRGGLGCLCVAVVSSCYLCLWR
ncbi:hypothetical protein BAUCODRAFT_259487 [Baudoinia panamericana UAMH 10762]|uniref:Uncharacterized protein n=1 Tax=Baudoinia panamericana (strain UAMH 10762) TaxID=717646 RepID=M2N1A5_BAUPA|nr:uncharacterized protein BAUCODRAFT_259487 [Baudoinia panamericana UAMH 10762]EMC92714.1 hypothetical protein BAUCODRAFT_259487 [Baudoinia panamericana UAMH 10762]